MVIWYHSMLFKSRKESDLIVICTTFYHIVGHSELKRNSNQTYLSSSIGDCPVPWLISLPKCSSISSSLYCQNNNSEFSVFWPEKINAKMSNIRRIKTCVSVTMVTTNLPWILNRNFSYWPKLMTKRSVKVCISERKL